MVLTNLCIFALALLAVTVFANMSRFTREVPSSDRDVRSRSLREATSASSTDAQEELELAVMEKLGEDIRIEMLNAEIEPSSCAGTPNRTVIRKEDVELACTEFRSKRPTILEAFGHLGNEAVQNAKELRDHIQKQEKHGGRVRLALGATRSKKGRFLPALHPIVDITNATRLSALLEESSVETIIASHVLEYFTYPQAVQAFQNVQCLLTDDGIARFKVPEAQHSQVYHQYHPDKHFRANYWNALHSNHQIRWTEEKFAIAASLAGLNARPLEWWSAEESRYCGVEYNKNQANMLSEQTFENSYAQMSLIVDLSPQVLE